MNIYINKQEDTLSIDKLELKTLDKTFLLGSCYIDFNEYEQFNFTGLSGTKNEKHHIKKITINTTEQINKILISNKEVSFIKINENTYEIILNIENILYNETFLLIESDIMYNLPQFKYFTSYDLIETESTRFIL